MYTAFIGRRLLDLYNIHRRDGPLLSPRQFFDEVFFPLVFDDDRYLMLANNSKFDQIAKQKKHRDAQERRHALALFHDDVETLDYPSSLTAIFANCSPTQSRLSEWWVDAYQCPQWVQAV